MESVIKEELKEFEEEYNIEIISARDTGSRAWNLQSQKTMLPKTMRRTGA